MADFFNHWFLLSLIGAPELWSILIIFFVIFYIGMKVLKREKRKKMKKFLWVVIPTLLAVFLIVHGMKFFTGIPRPCTPCSYDAVDCNPYCPHDSGFPSGHAAVIFSVFTSGLLVSRRKAGMPLVVVPLLVAASRIMLGVHNLPDVVFGSILGMLIALIVWGLEREKMGLFKANS